MPQLRQYPAANDILSTDALWIDRIGVGTMQVPGNIVSPFAGSLIIASGVLLYPGSWWVKSSLGAFSGTLVQANTVSPGDSVVIGDIDYSVGVNNYTINAFAGDHILDHGVSGTSYVLNLSNTVTILVANSTVAPYTIANQWRAITYGS